MSRLINRRIIAVAVVVAIGLAFAVGAVLWSGATRMCLYEYEVVVEQLPAGEPWRYVNVTSADLAAHPFIDRVFRAYHDPSLNPVSFFRERAFVYPVLPNESRMEVLAANDFLNERWGVRSYPLILTMGDGVFYTWALEVSDPGEIRPCP